MRAAAAWVLVATGAAMIAYPLLVVRFSSFAHARLVDEARRPRGASNAVPIPLAEGALLGTLEIPAIGLETAFVEGVADETLLIAPGHVPGTEMPGSRGASVVTAHRDLHFRNLHRVGVGDRVLVRGSGGVRRYEVTRTDVVHPRTAWVTTPTNDEVLRLVTCWPPRFVGPAPERLVVSARPIEASAEGDGRSPGGIEIAPVAAVARTPVPAAGLGTVGVVVGAMACFAAVRGRRTRTTFAALCAGTALTVCSLLVASPA